MIPLLRLCAVLPRNPRLDLSFKHTTSFLPQKALRSSEAQP
jgi:hypothetical protein